MIITILVITWLTTTIQLILQLRKAKKKILDLDLQLATERQAGINLQVKALEEMAQVIQTSLQIAKAAEEYCEQVAGTNCNVELMTQITHSALERDTALRAILELLAEKYPEDKHIHESILTALSE